MISNTKAECQLLEWDTNFFGFRIARVIGDKLSQQKAQNIDSFCQENQIKCLYFLSTINDPETTKIAESNNFRFVDIRITFSHIRQFVNQDESIDSKVNSDLHLRNVQPHDVSQLMEISRNSYRDTRFFYDTNFPYYFAEKLYETWIQVSCEGYADHLIVAARAEECLGYITCHINRQDESGTIGLVGVHHNSQGQGIGKKLVWAAIDWFKQKWCSSITVVTQGRNYPAQRLYQRCGFITKELNLWYHKWYPGQE
jgi:ribosomal protein S18 acetylase RimI-like enzyme